MGEKSAPSHRNPSFIVTQELDQAVTSTVILFEKDPALRKIISFALHQQGINVQSAWDSRQARQLIVKETAAMFIVALDLPKGTCGDLINLYRGRQDNKPGVVLLLTTQRPSDPWRNRYQPEIVIYKPFDIRFLVRRVKDLLHNENYSTNKHSKGEQPAG